MTRVLLALWALFAALATAPASAGSHMFDVDDVAQFDILPGWRTDQGTHMTALRVQLAPGWKTYWRAPGEGGIPPRFDWSGSENLAGVAFHWPTPQVFEQNGMRSVGFKRELVLPIELKPQRRGAPIAMRADLEIGICEDICIPVALQIAADIGGAGAADPRIKAALNARPRAAGAAGVTDVVCSVDPIRDGLRVTARIAMPAIGPDEMAVFELPDQRIWVSEAMAQRHGAVLSAQTDMVPPTGRPFALDRSQVRITVMSAGRAVEIIGCPG